MVLVVVCCPLMEVTRTVSTNVMVLV